MLSFCAIYNITQHVNEHRDRSTGFESNKNGRVRKAHSPKKEKNLFNNTTQQNHTIEAFLFVFENLFFSPLSLFLYGFLTDQTERLLKYLMVVCGLVK